MEHADRPVWLKEQEWVEQALQIMLDEYSQETKLRELYTQAYMAGYETGSKEGYRQ